MFVEIRTPEPHSESQRRIMEAFLTPGLLEMVICCGTKYGKTLSCASAMAIAAPISSHTLWRWVAPIYQQSRIGFRYCRKLLPPKPWVMDRESAMTLAIPAIDTTLQFCHGQDPKSLEGEATAGNVIDEAAKQKYDVYAAVRTTTTLTRGPIVMPSTPTGKNWFYDKFLEAQEEEARALREGRSPTMVAITAPTSDNPFVPRSSIEFARKTLPDRLFRQYYLAEFVDDGSVFLGVRACINTDLIDFCFRSYQKWAAPNPKDRSVVIGVDWARQEDFVVFYAIDVETGECAGFYRFHRIPYTEAIRRLVGWSRQFRENLMCLHDKTGVGVAIDDQLAHTDMTYHGVTFTNALKADMVAKLITGFETKDLKVPNWSTLIAELDAYEVRTTAIGLVAYGAPGGKHDDCVSALLLAYTAYLQYGYDRMRVRTLEELLTPRVEEPSVLETYYNSFDDEDY